MSTPRRAHLVPLLLGGGALAVGVALGLGSTTGSAPSSLPSISAPQGPASAAASASASTSASPPAPAAPDLSGPDVGTVLVAEARELAALAVRDRRLWWLTTTPARLQSAPLEGGEVTTLFESRVEGDFGGTLVVDDGGIYWSVESGARQSEPIYFLPAPATTAPAQPPEPLALGAAPRNLVLEGGPLSWSNLGTLMTLGADGAPKKVVERERRISTLTRCDGDLAWIEIPYEGDPKPRLMRLRAGQQAPQALADLVAGEHDLLRCHGDSLYWTVDGPGDEHWLMKAPARGGAAERVLRSGPVVALTIASGALLWAEAHGSEDDPVVLLWRLRSGAEPERLGRDRGPLSALWFQPSGDSEADVGNVYWAAAAGSKRLTLTAAARPAPP